VIKFQVMEPTATKITVELLVANYIRMHGHAPSAKQITKLRAKHPER
jgi:hypothetical protein